MRCCSALSQSGSIIQEVVWSYPPDPDAEVPLAQLLDSVERTLR